MKGRTEAKWTVLKGSLEQKSFNWGKKSIITRKQSRKCLNSESSNSDQVIQLNWMLEDQTRCDLAQVFFIDNFIKHILGTLCFDVGRKRRRIVRVSVKNSSLTSHRGLENYVTSYGVTLPGNFTNVSNKHNNQVSWLTNNTIHKKKQKASMLTLREPF